jgi:hypothetical protein
LVLVHAFDIFARLIFHVSPFFLFLAFWTQDASGRGEATVLSKMPCAQEVAEDAEALILKHFTTWDAVA